MQLFLHRNGQQQGPYPLETVKEMARAGGLPDDALIWHAGMPAWQPLAQFLGAQPLPTGGPPPLRLASSLPPAKPPPIAGITPRPPARPAGIGKIIARIGYGLAVLFVGFIGFRMVQFYNYMKNHPRQAKPGETEFREANRQIYSFRGSVAFGNSAEARNLAGEYSKFMKYAREKYFTGGKRGDFSLAKGEFLTYCELRADRCAFLVHVPELRQYTDSAQESLNVLAWESAHAILQNQRAGKPGMKLAVGLRGAALYGTIMVGEYVGNVSKTNKGVHKSAEGMQGLELLYPFFAPATAPPR